MKLLVLVSLIFSFSVFAQHNSAPEKFTSFIPVGHYLGQTDAGLECQVIVSEVNFPRKDVSVRVIEGESDLSKLIAENSEFGYKDYKREFIQQDLSVVGTSTDNTVENIVRTVSAGNSSQYVVVEHAVTINRVREVETAKCVIDL